MKRLAAYGAIYFLWGASFLAIRVLVHAVPPLLAAGTRFALAGLVLVAFSLARRHPQPRAREWPNLILLALILFVGDYALLFTAEQHLSSGIAAVTAATIPAQVFLFEWLWLKRVRLTLLTALGLLLGLAGVAALVLPPASFHIAAFHTAAFQTAPAPSLDRYALLGLVAACFWGFGTVLSTRLTLPQARPVSAGYQMTFGGLALLILSAATGEWSHLHRAALTPTVLLSLLYLITCASLIAFSAYIYLLQHEPASRVASYAYVNPIVALLLGTFLAAEPLTRTQTLACIVIIAGVLLTLTGRRPTQTRLPTN